MDRKPFMRIRVSGGEPLFASPDTVQPYNSDKKVDYRIGVDFWVEFFERLDPIIEELKNSKELYIVQENDWDIVNSPWPSFIADSPNRVNIRFDTNGISFSNPEVSNYFIDKIYNLHKNNKLKNLKIWIDYSFKGATPTEYEWSQKLSLPTTSKNNDVDYDINMHPQYHGLKNLRSDIAEIRAQDSSFAAVLDITVEKGIDHDREHRIYVYNQDAFHWDFLAKKANVTFSPVRNDMSVVYTYGGGPWGLFKSGKALLNRYFNQSAALSLFSNDDEISLLPNESDAVNRALDFMDRHNQEEKYFGILSLEQVEIDKEETEKIAQKYAERTRSIKKDVHVEGWILSGSMTNWIIALSKNMWGAPAKYREEWENLLQEGQYLFFYTTRPISGIIGYAKVGEKIVGKEPLWPDEIEMNKVKYPYRWSFKPIFLLLREQWYSGAISLKGMNIPFFGGMNALTRKENLVRLAQLIKDRWNIVL